MTRINFRRPGITLAALTFVAGGAWAAAPDTLDQQTETHAIGIPVPVTADFRLGTEMVVHDWVLCVSQDSAESIAKARSKGMAEALAAYADLKAAKTCGQFPELHVILRQAVYQSDPQIDHMAGVFAASVNIGGGWPDGFVVYGGLSETP
jgi:hypothetical protein